MLKMPGNDIFENNVYSWYSWSADVVQTPSEAQQAFDELHLIGKTIVSLKIVGREYNYDPNDLEDDAKELRTGESLSYPLCLKLDEPMIISFSDGDRLEIDFSEGSCLRLSKNRLPVNIQSGIHRPECFQVRPELDLVETGCPTTGIKWRRCSKKIGEDVSELFWGCLGEAIVGFEILGTDSCPDFTGSHGLIIPDDIKEFIDEVSIVLSNGKRIKFAAWFDYGDVMAVDESG